MGDGSILGVPGSREEARNPLAVRPSPAQPGILETGQPTGPGEIAVGPLPGTGGPLSATIEPAEIEQRLEEARAEHLARVAPQIEQIDEVARELEARLAAVPQMEAPRTQRSLIGLVFGGAAYRKQQQGRTVRLQSQAAAPILSSLISLANTRASLMREDALTQALAGAFATRLQGNEQRTFTAQIVQAGIDAGIAIDPVSAMNTVLSGQPKLEPTARLNAQQMNTTLNFTDKFKSSEDVEKWLNQTKSDPATRLAAQSSWQTAEKIRQEVAAARGAGQDPPRFGQFKDREEARDRVNDTIDNWLTTRPEIVKWVADTATIPHPETGKLQKVPMLVGTGDQLKVSGHREFTIPLRQLYEEASNELGLTTQERALLWPHLFGITLPTSDPSDPTAGLNREQIDALLEELGRADAAQTSPEPGAE